MKALILAAGYATRMHPLTRDRAKPLLGVGGRPIIDYIAQNICSAPQVDDLLVVANHRFIDQFQEWAASRDFGVPLRILDDGTTSDEERLGAIGDIQFAVEHAQIEGDLLISAGDNLFTFPLAQMVDFFDAKRADVISAYVQTDEERLRRTGVATLDADGRVEQFAEKPPCPTSQWAVPPLYIFQSKTVADIATYLSEGGSPDAPGNFLEWLCGRTPVYAFCLDEAPHDLGSLESYRTVDQLFTNPGS